MKCRYCGTDSREQLVDYPDDAHISCALRWISEGITEEISMAISDIKADLQVELDNLRDEIKRINNGSTSN